MPMVEVPEVVLTKSGIPNRYLSFGLANLKKFHEHADTYKVCCRYTRNLSSAIKKGIGLCIYGEQTSLRKYAYYGVLKAAVAQDKSVLSIDIEDIIESHSQKSEMYRECFKVDILGIPEMELPSTVVNAYYQSIIYKMFKKRSEQGKPIVLCTSLEVVHPDSSLDFLYKGVGQFITENTILVNMQPDNKCEWIRKGHRMQISSLAGIKLKGKSE